MSCPLYKAMKTNGTSFYAFPGASEDIASSRNNPNISFYFSNYVLVNFPAQNLTAGTQSNPIRFDFDNAFYKLNATGQQAESYSEQLVESLRNYIANHEVTIRDSKLNNTEFYYDSTLLSTTSEKIFFKWCRKLNLIQFEQAIDGDEYFGNLTEFERNSLTDDEYFDEILWKEREIKDYGIKYIRQSIATGFTSKIMIEFDTTLTNYKVGDIIKISELINSSPYILSNGSQYEILAIVEPYSTFNQQVVINVNYTTEDLSGAGKANLVYHKLIQYIGNINGVNNVQEANRSYQEVWAHVPAHTGQTPDILFRTIADRNYKPNMIFPILPSQYQPEILGAELFNSPIVNTPQNYPGNFYGQFDSQYEYTYRTSDGDSIRRSGEYFGISGTINDPVIDTESLDGLSLDFNTDHYVKMNIIDNEMGTFEQFNAMMINNEPPADFDFNAILWYYTLEDNEGNTATNLYGISFLDNPDNNPIESEAALRIPTIKKLVATDLQDGTAYSFSLNLNYYITNENPQDTFNPSAINSLFSFNLFNEAMTRLAQSNDSFSEIIAEQNSLITEIENIKQLVYTQADFSNINNKISYLERLLLSLQTSQIESSDTIQVTYNEGVNGFPSFTLRNIDTQYQTILNINSTTLYDDNGIIAGKVVTPLNKNFLINVINNDTKFQTLTNNDKLVIYLDADLSYKQSCDVIINSTDLATQNKQVELYINYTANSSTVLTRALGPIDFPIYYNTNLQASNLAKTSTDLSFDINLSSSIELSSSNFLQVPLLNITSAILANTVSKGEVFYINNLLVGTSSSVDLSGQYVVDSVSSNNIIFDVSSNPIAVNYVTQNVSTTSLVLNNLLTNKPFITINKGYKFRITRITSDVDASFTNRYLIEKI